MKPKLTFLISIIGLLYITAYSQNFEKTYKAIASDRTERDYFGSVIDLSGNYAIIGAPSDDEDTSGANTLSNAGSAYIFERDANANWNEVIKLVASERAENDFFGTSVAVAGNYAVVGAPQEDADSAGFHPLDNAGSVYIYERNPYGDWRFKQRLVAEDREFGAYFGQSVSISEDYLAVGANLEAKDSAGENPVNNAGAVYLYKRFGNLGWGQIQKLVASDRSEEAHFGFSLCIDGTRLAVGAVRESYNVSGVNYLQDAGAVYIYEMDQFGGFYEADKVVASDREEMAWLGNSVCLEGDDLLAGAAAESKDEAGTDPLDYAGAVYVIRRGGNGHWSEVQKLVASNRQEGDMFGSSVSISGHYAIVGSSEDCNTAYILEGGSDKIWDEIQLINDTAFYNNDYLYADISGDYAIISSNYDHYSPAGDDSIYHAGAAYIFESCIPLPCCDMDPENILINGNFEDCMLSPWSVYNADNLGVTADAVLTDGECTVTNISLADEPNIYQVQLQQLLSASQIERLEEGATYELTFDAYAETDNRPCRVSFEQSIDPWANIFNETIELRTTPSSYSFEFVVGTVYEDMQLCLQLGNETGSATIDNVRLVKKPGISVDDRTIENSVRIMPNPAIDYLIVKAPEKSEVHLYNNLGILIKEITVNDSEVQLNLSGLTKGIYLVEVKSNNAISISKVIVQ